MGEHIDTQVRKNAVEILKGLDTSRDRVYPSRVKTMKDSNLPGLRVFTPGADIQTEGINPNPTLQRDPLLVVECCAKANEDADDVVDQMSLEVEVIIANSNTLSGVVHYASLIRTETSFDGEGEKQIAVKRLIYQCRTFTEMNAPDTPS